jgi:hypothetical protein
MDIAEEQISRLARPDLPSPCPAFGPDDNRQEFESSKGCASYVILVTY